MFFWKPKIIVLGHSANCHFAQLSSQLLFSDNGESFLGTKSYSARSFCHLSFCPIVILSLSQWWNYFWGLKIMVLDHSATCHFSKLSFCQHDILLFGLNVVLGHSETCHFAKLSFSLHLNSFFPTMVKVFLGTKNYGAMSFLLPVILPNCHFVILTMVEVFLELKIMVLDHSATCHFAQLSFC